MSESGRIYVSTPYVSAGIGGGGLLTVKSLLPSKHIFSATMKWDDGDTITGNISTNVVDSIRNLEAALRLNARETNQLLPGDI